MHVHSAGHYATQVATQSTNLGTDAETPPSTVDGQGVSSGARPADRVDLSPAARAMLEGSGDSAGPGKSGLSPAHRARALIAAQPELANMPFGKVVSGLIHGTLSLQPSASDTTTSQAAGPTDPAMGTVGTETMATDSAGTDGSSSDAAASTADSTSTDASQTTTTTDTTSSTDGTDSGTSVTDIVPPPPTVDTQSMLLDALTNTNQDSTASGTAA